MINHTKLSLEVFCVYIIKFQAIVSHQLVHLYKSDPLVDGNWFRMCRDDQNAN